MTSKPINKSNPKNIYCDHCEHFKQYSTSKYGTPTYRCENLRSSQFHLEKNYWNRCKCFEWKKDGNYV